MNYPALFLDKKIVNKNINKMVVKASDLDIELRPHFKTHQSHEIGKWIRKKGVKGITVSSLKMAEYFAIDEWESITIAFPVNILESQRINRLASEIDLRVLATDKEVLKELDQQLTNKLGIYIELDPGYNRSGILIDDFDKLNEIREFIMKAQNLRFEGFYTHTGHSYKCRSKQEIESLTEPILSSLAKLKSIFNDPICFGDTPSCSMLNSFPSIDQISPGNFVFYDWTQFNIGSCSSNEIAVAMYCPVVAMYPERNEVLIHGGAVHFSKDFFIDNNGDPFYGVVVRSLKKGWGVPILGNTLISISQEHGIVKCTPSFFKELKVGDIVTILPIHSCLTADIMGGYFTLEGQSIDHMNKKAFY